MHFGTAFAVILSIFPIARVFAKPVALQEPYGQAEIPNTNSLDEFEERIGQGVHIDDGPIQQTAPTPSASPSPKATPPPSDCESNDNLTPWGTVETCGPPPVPKNGRGDNRTSLLKGTHDFITVITEADVTWCRPWPNTVIPISSGRRIYKWTELNLTCWVETNRTTPATEGGPSQANTTDVWVKTGDQGCYINENDLSAGDVSFEQLLKPCPQMLGPRPLEPNPGKSSPTANSSASATKSASPLLLPTIILPDPKSSSAFPTTIVPSVITIFVPTPQASAPVSSPNAPLPPASPSAPVSSVSPLSLLSPISSVFPTAPASPIVSPFSTTTVIPPPPAKSSTPSTIATVAPPSPPKSSVAPASFSSSASALASASPTPPSIAPSSSNWPLLSPSSSTLRAVATAGGSPPVQAPPVQQPSVQSLPIPPQSPKAPPASSPAKTPAIIPVASSLNSQPSSNSSSIHSGSKLPLIQPAASSASAAASVMAPVPETHSTHAKT